MIQCVHMSENRQKKFKRLANQRTNVILNKLRLLGNLSNRTNYDYSEEDVRKIFKAVDDQLKLIKMKFQKSIKKEFKL